MKKAEKDNLLDLINTITEAIPVFEEYFEADRFDVLKDSLSLCQTVARDAFDLIDKVIGRTDELRTLSKIYENIFLLTGSSKRREDEFHYLIKEIKSDITSLLIGLDKFSVVNDIVFIPTEAKFWDCFESIYLSFKDDERFNCIVMPAPYYERIGKLYEPELKYDSSDFPKDVKITLVDEYDLEKNKPSVIFINNPYDDNNDRVSVIPEFFSKKLKQYTDNLIYIPFEMNGGELNKSVVFQPAFENIDYLVTQSEEQIKQYLQFGMDKNKILPLGSPKVDYAVKKQKEYVVDEFKNKKVVFFCLTLDYVLKNGFKALEKVTHIFNFVKHNENVVLILRTDPKLDDLIQLHAPMLFDEYKKTHNLFISVDNIINDTKSIYSDIIVKCDAYVGVQSPHVHLFGVLGKPIFLLDNNLIDYSIADISSSNALVHENTLYSFNKNINALMNINLESGDVNYISKVSTEIEYSKHLYGDVLLVNNKLFFSPYLANDVAIFDIEKNEFERIVIKKDNNIDSKQKFSKMKIIGNQVIFTPVFYSCVIGIDLDTLEVSYSTNINEFMLVDPNKPVFLEAVEVYKDKICFASAQSNDILMYNINTTKMDVLKINENNYGYTSSLLVDHELFLATNYKDIFVKLDLNTLEHTEYSCSSYTDNHIFKMFDFNDKIIMLKNFNNVFLVYDKNTGELSKEKYEINIDDEDVISYEYAVKYSEEEILVLNVLDNNIYFINVLDKTVRKLNKVLKENTIKKDYFINKFANCGPDLPFACRESFDTKFEDFIEFIANDGFELKDEQIMRYNKIQKFIDGTCGENIRKYIEQNILKM